MAGVFKNSFTSKRVHAILHVLFGVYLFFYFYCLQSPLLELTQYFLSEGKTIYNPLISALTLTFVALLIQRVVGRCLKTPQTFAFLEYVPSAIFAVLLTAFTPQMNVYIISACGIVLLIFVIVALLFAKSNSCASTGEACFFSVFSSNALGMLLVMSFIGGCANSNDVERYELLISRFINKHEYDKALTCGSKSLASSQRLTALRAYALTLAGEGLGHGLFKYPMYKRGADQLLFSCSDTLAQLLPPDSLYGKIGVWPGRQETPIAYFNRAQKRSSSSFIKEYWLSALLLEKDLKRFSSEIVKYYCPLDSCSLPIHYQEALMISREKGYLHASFIGDSVICKQYQDFLAPKGDLYGSNTEKKIKYKKYRATYWWYYYYQN